MFEAPASCARFGAALNLANTRVGCASLPLITTESTAEAAKTLDSTTNPANNRIITFFTKLRFFSGPNRYRTVFLRPGLRVKNRRNCHGIHPVGQAEFVPHQRVGASLLIGKE